MGISSAVSGCHLYGSKSISCLRTTIIARMLSAGTGESALRYHQSKGSSSSSKMSSPIIMGFFAYPPEKVYFTPKVNKAAIDLATSFVYHDLLLSGTVP